VIIRSERPWWTSYLIILGVVAIAAGLWSAFYGVTQCNTQVTQIVQSPQAKSAEILAHLGPVLPSPLGNVATAVRAEETVVTERALAVVLVQTLLLIVAGLSMIIVGLVLLVVGLVPVRAIVAVVDPELKALVRLRDGVPSAT